MIRFEPLHPETTSKHCLILIRCAFPFRSAALLCCIFTLDRGHDHALEVTFGWRIICSRSCPLERNGRWHIKPLSEMRSNFNLVDPITLVSCVTGLNTSEANSGISCGMERTSHRGVRCRRIRKKNIIGWWGEQVSNNTCM